MEHEPYHLQTENDANETSQCDARFFRHIDPTLPPLPEAEILALMREMGSWSLWHKLGWLEAAGKYLEAKGIDTNNSSPTGNWS